MTRRKITLAYIQDDSVRKQSFKKRKKGFMKKVHEISTLCGVDACAIVTSSFEDDPEVWPSQMGAQLVIDKFRRLPEWDQGKKMANQESFTKERIRKTEEKMRKLQKENWNKDISKAIFEYLENDNQDLRKFSVARLNDIGWMVDENLRNITSKIESLKPETLPPPANNMVNEMPGPGSLEGAWTNPDTSMVEVQNQAWNGTSPETPMTAFLNQPETPITSFINQPWNATILETPVSSIINQPLSQNQQWNRNPETPLSSMMLNQPWNNSLQNHQWNVAPDTPLAAMLNQPWNNAIQNQPWNYEMHNQPWNYEMQNQPWNVTSAGTSMAAAQKQPWNYEMQNQPWNVTSAGTSMAAAQKQPWNANPAEKSMALTQNRQPWNATPAEKSIAPTQNQQPWNELPNEPWNMDFQEPNVQPGFDWDNNLPPYDFNNDGAGPSSFIP